MAVVFYILVVLHFSRFTEGSTFQPVVHETSSSQCGQSDIFEDDKKLMESLETIHHQIPPPGCNPEVITVSMFRYSTLLLICLLRLLPDQGCQWLSFSGLL